MITPMNYAKALKVAELGPRTEAQRAQAVKALQRMANGFAKDGNRTAAKQIRSQAKVLADTKL